MPVSDPRDARPLGRQRARSRAALIGAAGAILATRGTTDVSIQAITDEAGVGLGTFYNHFDTKVELFEAAVTELLEEHCARLDALTVGMDDPAEVFSASVRLTAELARTSPEAARVFVNAGVKQVVSSRGLAPQALRDIERALEAGRFTGIDPHVALACAAGCLLAYMALVLESPEVLGDDAGSQLSAGLLVLFGMSRRQADSVARRPLPS